MIILFINICPIFLRSTTASNVISERDSIYHIEEFRSKLINLIEVPRRGVKWFLFSFLKAFANSYHLQL